LVVSNRQEGATKITAADDRLRFAVEFAQMDLAKLKTAAAWRTLQEDFDAFLEGRPEQPTPVAAFGGIRTSRYGATPLAELASVPSRPRREEVLQQTQEYAKALQLTVRRFLVSYLDARRQREGGASTRTPLPGIRLKEDATLRLFPVRIRKGWINVLEFWGPDAFLVTLVFLLKQAGPDRLRRCPGCPRMFFRVRRQRYCSRRCMTRESVRAWRLRAKGQSLARR
jgi:hypothetical protein